METCTPRRPAFNERYQYVSLNDDGQTFRVLYLLPDAEFEPFQCDFLEVPINAKSGFSALSYAWESDAIASKVWVRGRYIGITASLANALSRLRHATQPQALWIDALCINQNDALEKNVQLPLMAHIYGKSCTLLIYLGVEQQSSQVVPQMCHAILNAFEKSGIKVEFGKRPSDNRKLKASEFPEYGLPGRNHQLWDAFRAFMMRPWFRRVWVIQEAVLSTQAEVLCGSWTLDLNTMMAAIYFAVVLDLPVFPGQEHEERTVPISMVMFMQSLGAGRSKKKRLRLLQLLHKCRVASASDAHDYCYGLLALAIDGRDPDLRPDYRRTVSEDYIRFAKYFVKKGDGLITLYNAAGRTLNLPSWIPDWSFRNPLHLSLAPDPTAREHSTKIYTAATTAASNIHLHSTQPTVLVVHGIVFDQIVCTSNIVEEPKIKGRENLDELIARVRKFGFTDSPDFSSRQKYIFLQKVSYYQTVAEYVNNLKVLLEDFWGSRIYPTMEDLDTVLWRTAICNSSGQAAQKAPSTYQELFRAFKLLIHRFSRSWPTPDTQKSLEEIPDIDLDQIVNKSDRFMQLVHSFWHGRTTARTLKGYVGQVPSNTQFKDYIFLPLGSAIPFVIRKRCTSITTYELIGECYIHGIMNGELFSSTVQSQEVFIG